MAVVEEETDSEGQELADLNLWEGSSDIDELQTPNLGPEEREQLLHLVREFGSVFRSTPGRTSIVEHEISVVDETSIRQKPYRVSYAGKSRKCWMLMSIGPQPVIVGKDGSVRFCVDYRKLNQVARFDAYPMPRIEELLDCIGPAKYTNTKDLAKGYWQIPLSQASKEKSTFTTPFGLYEFQVMPFGLHNAPATFQRTMNEVLEGCDGFAGCYIDDLVVYRKSWEQHLQHLREVLGRLKAANLTVKMKKCQFGQREVHYLGHVIGNGRVRPDPQKLQAVVEYPCPVTKKDVRAFLGLVGYYRRFIPSFASVAAPLTDLTRKKQPEKVVWSAECADAFQALKETLLHHPILSVVDPTKNFLLQTDALKQGLGAVLSQRDPEGQENPSCCICKSEITAKGKELLYHRKGVLGCHMGIQNILHLPLWAEV